VVITSSPAVVVET